MARARATRSPAWPRRRSCMRTSRAATARRQGRRPRGSLTVQVVRSRALALPADDVLDLVHRLGDLPVLIDDHVVVLGGGRHLDLGVAQAEIERLGRLRATTLEAAAKRFDRWRHDEDRYRIGKHRLQLSHALRIRLDDHHGVIAQRFSERVLANTLVVVVDHRPLQEQAILDRLAEFLGGIEVVVHRLDLAGPRRTTRRRDVELRVGQLLHEPMDDRVLSRARRRRDDHEESLPQAASSPYGGAVTSGVPSEARTARRSSGSGALKVRSPACGSRTVSRQAWRNCRRNPIGSPRRPYTGSPTTGYPAKARCARIWCVLPVIGRTCKSARSGLRCHAAMREKRVVASLPPVSMAMRRRSFASRRSGASITLGRGPGSPQTSGRYSLSNSFPCSCRASARCAVW